MEKHWYTGTVLLKNYKSNPYNLLNFETKNMNFNAFLFQIEL